MADTKDQLAEIEKGCGKVMKKYDSKYLGCVCGGKNQLRWICQECQSNKKYFLLGAISQLKEELEFLKSGIKKCIYCECFKDKSFIQERIEQITADLNFYENKLKELK